MNNKKISIIVCGAKGRMGSEIIQKMKAEKNLELAGAVDIKKGGEILKPENFPKLLENADISVDFTNPEASLKFAAASAKFKKPIVIGTTGFTEKQKRELKRYSRKTPVFISPNMSAAVILTAALSAFIAEKLPDFDINIFETHHKFKKDAPSGTAIMIKNGIKKKYSGIISVQSARIGDIAGEHAVVFAGEGERLKLSHKAQSRSIFAGGALKAAKWLVSKKPGFYDYFDILRLRKLK